MDFTKIEPFEYNGTLLINSQPLVKFIMDKLNVSKGSASGRLSKGNILLKKGVDYLVASEEPNLRKNFHQRTFLYTASGLKKNCTSTTPFNS